MADRDKTGKRGGWLNGVNDNTQEHKPKKFALKKAKYGFHGKDLSKTRQIEESA